MFFQFFFMGWKTDFTVLGFFFTVFSTSEENAEEWYFPSSELDFTEEVDSCSGKSVSKGGLYPPRVGLAASSEARAVIETQGG